jgi:HEAT repeat protein
VAATASKPPAPPGDWRVKLTLLVRNFDRDAAENRKLIRHLLEDDREAFYRVAVEILKNQNDSRGCHYLMTLFVAYNLLLRALCDPAMSKEQALTLARSAIRVDSMTDVSLARSLAETSAEGETQVSSRDAGRIMEILGEISDGTRILPSLMRMLRHPNPYLRSKAVKMIGRGSRSVRWVQNRLAESDPRIRANAIEALWGVDTDEARDLLQTATRDGNNRVAGNALTALCRIGDNSVIPDILKMAEHESALFRSTAAWVMGESGDPRFTETLAGLMRDTNAAVRSRALSALGRIKAALALSRQGEPWVVSVMAQDPAVSKTGRRIQIAVAGADGRHFPDILPTQMLVSENGQIIQTYRVVERIVTEAMSVVFAFPRTAVPGGSAWARGVQACAAWKRPSDLWAAAPYLAGEGSAAAGGASEEPARFTSSAEAIQSSFEHLAPRQDCTDLWYTLWRSVRNDQPQSRGRRHLIVVSEGEPPQSAGDGLVSAVLASRSSLQVIASDRNPKVEDFCRRARATYQVAETQGEMVSCIEMAYLNLLARYELSWQSAFPDPGVLKVRINSPAGFGETTVPLALQVES